MKSTGKIWIILDKSTQKQTKPLSTLQAQAAVLAISSKHIKRYYIWTPGWAEWLPLQEFLKSEQTYFVVAPQPQFKDIDDDKTIKLDDPSESTITKVIHPDVNDPTAISYTDIEDSPAKKGGRVDYGYYHNDFNAEQIDPDAKHSFKIKMARKKRPRDRDRRVNARHAFKLEVTIISKTGRSFRTYSENISIGGTLLHDELPKEFLNTQFELILVNHFERDIRKGRLHFQGRIVGDYSDPRRLMFMDADLETIRRLEEMLKSYARHQEMKKGRGTG